VCFLPESLPLTDFTTGTSPVDIEALAERYENPDFWRRSLQEADDDGSAY
jgi:hypothetical protein